MRDAHPRLLTQILHAPADPLDDVEVEPVDEMRLLKHGDEDARRDEPPLRIAPARERLESADLPRERAHLRLVEHLDPAPLERLGEMRQEIRAQVQLLLHRRVEPRDVAVVDALDAVAGELHAVKDPRDVIHALLRRIGAHLDRQGKPRLCLRDLRTRAMDRGDDLRRLRDHDEPIIIETRHRHVAEHLRERLRDADEELVARLEAEPLVDEAEILHVEIEERHVLLRELPLRLLHELHHRRQPRELIAPHLPERRR